MTDGVGGDDKRLTEFLRSSTTRSSQNNQGLWNDGNRSILITYGE